MLQNGCQKRKIEFKQPSQQQFILNLRNNQKYITDPSAPVCFFLFICLLLFFFAELHGDQRGQTASSWVKLWAKGPKYGLKQLSSNSSATVQPLLVSFSCNLKRGSCSVNCWFNPVNLLMLCLKLLQATPKHLIWDMDCETLWSVTLIKIIFK